MLAWHLRKSGNRDLLRAEVIVNKVVFCTNLHLKSFSRKQGAAHFTKQTIHLQEKQILFWNDLSILLVTFLINYWRPDIFLFKMYFFFWERQEVSGSRLKSAAFVYLFIFYRFSIFSRTKSDQINQKMIFEWKSWSKCLWDCILEHFAWCIFLDG